MTTVRVALPLPLPQTFTYAVPESLEDRVAPGHRVVVPFGPRTLTGVIVDVGTEQGDFRDILDIPDEQPALTPELLRLTEWIASYYLCSHGEAIRAALPSGIELESRRMVFPVTRRAVPTSPLEEAVWLYLQEEGPMPVDRLLKRFKGQLTPSALRRMEKAGLIRTGTYVQAPRVRIKTEAYIQPAAGLDSPEALREIRQQLRGHRQRQIIDALIAHLEQSRKAVPRRELLQQTGAGAGSLHALIKRGVLEQVSREAPRVFLPEPSPDRPAPARIPHPDQEAAIRLLTEHLQTERYGTFLLHGVTGSGKTAVYIAVMHEVLARGKTGIILVPEIALTPQTVQRFQRHFGTRIAVLHSRMSAGERYDAWRRIRRGEVSLVIGPRSAIFAPLERIGLIVVDEEHEPSYKQFDPAPRYHAREVAIMRAYMNDALCILGSATPSLESYANARRGKFHLLTMPRRVPAPDGETLPLPRVRVVDLREARRKRRMEGPFSHTLLEAIDARLERKEQIILFQNRRGYAPVVECADCGWSPRCPDCAVSLTFHRQKNQLRCHYCGRAIPMVRRCRACGSPELELLGSGTQRVEEELQRIFPHARILRMDLDTTGRKHAHSRMLAKFRRGEADILLGTQMVAKGLDFERVTLVGVIQADTGLLLPDFRAGERTFQLLTQVAGRAGRSTLGGEVILQTRYPDHPAIRCATRHDYTCFVEHELQERATFHYPPFGHLVGISFRGPEESRVAHTAEAVAMALQESLGERATVLGPEPAFIQRIQRQYRYQVLIRAPMETPRTWLKERIRAVEQRFHPPPSGVRWIIDVDPQSFF